MVCAVHGVFYKWFHLLAGSARGPGLRLAPMRAGGSGALKMRSRAAWYSASRSAKVLTGAAGGVLTAARLGVADSARFRTRTW